MAAKTAVSRKVHIAVDLIDNEFMDDLKRSLNRSLKAVDGLNKPHRKTETEMTINALITGTGSYLPEKVLTNTELSKTMETSDEWIKQRTGIEQRHVAAEGEHQTWPLPQAIARKC